MMSSTNEEDPFLQVQQDVLGQLQSTRSLFSSYLRIRSLTTDAKSPELAAARADLESALASLAEDLSDLVASVQAVESEPSHFGLSSTEVARRKLLVQEASGEVEDMREEIARRVGSHHHNNKPDQPLSNPSVFSDDDRKAPGQIRNEDGDDGDYATRFEEQQQLAMMRDQDQHLDGAFQTVGNLRRQADDMGRELEEQREMLEIVDTLADRVGGRLQTGMEKLRFVMRRNEDRWSSCCIWILILVLVILLVLLLAL